jgi:hypothetical protein
MGMRPPFRNGGATSRIGANPRGARHFSIPRRRGLLACVRAVNSLYGERYNEAHR